MNNLDVTYVNNLDVNNLDVNNNFYVNNLDVPPLMRASRKAYG